jgi:hypothetical protein
MCDHHCYMFGCCPHPHFCFWYEIPVYSHSRFFRMEWSWNVNSVFHLWSFFEWETRPVKNIASPVPYTWVNKISILVEGAYCHTLVGRTWCIYFVFHVDHNEDYRTRASVTFVLISRIVGVLDISVMLSSWYYKLVLWKQWGIRVYLHLFYVRMTVHIL